MKDKKNIALITGGLSGIGLETALMLAERGVDIAAVSSRAHQDQNSHAQDRIQAATSAHGNNAVFLTIDVRDPDRISQGVAEITTSLGNVSILVNAAGIYHREAIAGHSLDGWADTIAVNLTGPFLMIRSCWQMMVDAEHGRIINIASTAAHRGMQDYAGYCASKSGLLGLTQVTALEGAPFGITCNSISPSWVDTPMMENSLASQATDRGEDIARLYDETREQSPQMRIISPDEIAKQITWLALDAPISLTGEDILMTGGAQW